MYKHNFKDLQQIIVLLLLLHVLWLICDKCPHISHGVLIGLPIQTHRCVYTLSNPEKSADIKDGFWEVMLGMARRN